MSGSDPGDAAAYAATQFAAVADDPAGRLALASSTYDDPDGHGPSRRPPFRRAALSFMRWEAQRGVLNALDGDRPGSVWWRALNERLLCDACESLARASGRGGPPSSPTIAPWMEFTERPTARSWYRAHNASIVDAYLEHRDLAEHELRAERFFLNVVLARVLYAHALVAAPSLALGRLGVIGRALGDPRLGMVGIFLSLRRVLPDRYPLDDELELYLDAEQEFGRMLDFGVIVPRLAPLYEWSARELAEPRLAELVVGDTPAYAWSPQDRRAWSTPRLALRSRAVRSATAPRRR